VRKGKSYVTKSMQTSDAKPMRNFKWHVTIQTHKVQSGSPPPPYKSRGMSEGMPSFTTAILKLSLSL